MNKTFTSNARWPEFLQVDVGNVTTDQHDTYEQARAVCDILARCGFGGDYQVFPLDVWVEGFEDGVSQGRIDVDVSEFEGEVVPDDEPRDPFSDVEADANTLASAGYGTDEDYEHNLIDDQPEPCYGDE